VYPLHSPSSQDERDLAALYVSVADCGICSPSALLHVPSASINSQYTPKLYEYCLSQLAEDIGKPSVRQEINPVTYTRPGFEL